MEWIPVFFIAFKLLVLGTAAFYAIKSHADGERQEQEEERERQARASATGGGVQLGLVQRPVDASQCARQGGPR